MDGKAAREMKAEALYRSFPNRNKICFDRILKICCFMLRMIVSIGFRPSI